MEDLVVVFHVAGIFPRMTAEVRATQVPSPVEPAEPFLLDPAFPPCLRPFCYEKAAISPNDRHFG